MQMPDAAGPPASWSFGAGGMAGEYESTMTDSSNVVHNYALHTPTGYDPQKGTPLLIHFHGLASTLPFDFRKKLDTIWTATADQNGFIAVAPEALPCPQMANDPNPPGCWSPLRDSPFVKELVTALAAKYNIDRDRVYLSGHSNGAFFVDSIGFMDSGDYAAVVEWEGGCDDSSGGYTMCTTLDKLAKAAVRKMPYFTIHYPADMNIPSTWTDGLITVLNANGFPNQQLASYDGYNGGGNGHTPDPTVAPTVWAWLATHTR